MCRSRLESKEDQESHHETKESHGLGQSEAENGVGKELLLEARITGIPDYKTAKHRPDTGT